MNEDEAAGIRSYVSYSIDEIITFALGQIQVKDREMTEYLSQVFAKASVTVAVKAHLDPEIILRRQIGQIPIIKEALNPDFAVEIMPKIPVHKVEFLDNEIEQFADPLIQAIAHLALAGVPGTLTAGILMQLVEKILLEETGGNHRAVAIAIGQFAQAIDKKAA